MINNLLVKILIEILGVDLVKELALKGTSVFNDVLPQFSQSPSKHSDLIHGAFLLGYFSRGMSQDDLAKVSKYLKSGNHLKSVK